MKVDTAFLLRSANSYEEDFFLEIFKKIDPVRSRGLGEQHSRSFVRHSIDFSKRNKFRGTDEFAYIMFLMINLGSHFFDDPRFVLVSQPLLEPESLSTDRISQAHDRFQMLVGEYFGDEYSNVRAGLVNIKQSGFIFEHKNTASAVELLLAAFPPAKNISQNTWQKFIELGVHKPMETFNFSSPETAFLFTGLAFFLGVGFYKDPLFPWVLGKISTSSSEDEARLALDRYARKRLHKTLIFSGDRQ